MANRSYRQERKTDIARERAEATERTKAWKERSAERDRVRATTEYDEVFAQVYGKPQSAITDGEPSDPQKRQTISAARHVVKRRLGLSTA